MVNQNVIVRTNSRRKGKKRIAPIKEKCQRLKFKRSDYKNSTF